MVRALNRLAILIALLLVVPAAVLGGFWWTLPIHVQAEFGLPGAAWRSGAYVVLLFAWTFNQWPSHGIAFVSEQPFFRTKVVGLAVCVVGYAYGLLYASQMQGGTT